MVGIVKFEIQVPIRLHHDGRFAVASCDLLDLHGQGDDDSQAISSFIEALQVFAETCYEMGTLDQVLREAGFHPGEPPREASEAPWLSVPVSLVARCESACAC